MVSAVPLNIVGCMPPTSSAVPAIRLPGGLDLVEIHAAAEGHRVSARLLTCLLQLLDNGYETLNRTAMIVHPPAPAIGILRDEAQHPGAPGRNNDGRPLRPRATQHQFRVACAVVLPGVIHRSLFHRGMNDLDRFGKPRITVICRKTKSLVVVIRYVSGTETEYETAARDLVERFGDASRHRSQSVRGTEYGWADLDGRSRGSERSSPLADPLPVRRNRIVTWRPVPLIDQPYPHAVLPR